MRNLHDYISHLSASDGQRVGREYIPLFVLKITEEEKAEILAALQARAQAKDRAEATTHTFLAPIVGMVFRPPAGQVLSALPLGTDLLLRRQPENEYDSNAIQVLLEDFREGGHWNNLWTEAWQQAIDDEASLSRGQWYASALTNPLHLGYIAAKTGEAAQITAIMDSLEITSISAKLSATETGQPAAQGEVK